MELGINLIHQKLPDRINWMRTEADAYMMKGGSISDYNRVSEILNILGE